MKDNRWTPLTAAAHNGHTAVVDALAERGADVEHRDNWGRTPLFVAAVEGRAQVRERRKHIFVRALLFRLPPLVHLPPAPLMFTYVLPFGCHGEINRVQVVDALARHGARLDARSHTGQVRRALPNTHTTSYLPVCVFLPSAPLG